MSKQLSTVCIYKHVVWPNEHVKCGVTAVNSFILRYWQLMVTGSDVSGDGKAIQQSSRDYVLLTLPLCMCV